MLKRLRPKSKTGTVGRFLEAAHAGNRDRVSDFIRKGIDVNAANEIGVTGLHLAAKEGHVDVVSELVKRGSRVDAATRKGITALHVASLSGKVDVVQLLLDSSAKINIQSKDGFTPLYMAAQENHVETVRCLLSSGASQSLTTEDGFTALSVALQQGHDDVASVLLGHGTSSKLKLPQIHIATKKGDLRAVALLLRRNEDNINTTSKSGFTPLHIAAHYGNTDIGRLLIGKGADVNFRARNGISPLHVASKRGRSSLVSLLIDSGADVNCQTRDGISPLHCAVINGGSKVVGCLLQKGASFDAKTRNGLSSLHLAVQGDHVNCAKQLLHHGAPINDVSTEQLTPLHFAAHFGHVRSVRLLLEKKCEINPTAMNGFTPLHIAAKRNHKEIVELLIKHGAKVDARTQTGLTPLHVASFMGHSSVVSSLLRLGSNPDCTTTIGDTSLHFATRNQHIEVIDQLLHSGSQVDSRAADQVTPLHIAVQNGDFESAALLLHHGATPSAKTSDLNAPLHFTAAGSGKDGVTQLLLEHGASPTSANKKGFLPLHVAAKHGNVRVARLLLARNGVDPNAVCDNDLTPLHVAVHSNQINTALLLLEKGAEPNRQAKNGYTALHIAAAENRMNLVPYLLEHGADVNAESQTGFTPLHLSSKAGHLTMTTLLLERGASVDRASKDGLTPLHLVALGDRVPVAEILLQFGANINAETNSGLRPVHLASRSENAAMVEFLLARDAEISRVSPNGQVSISSSAEQLSTDSAVDLQGVGSDVLPTQQSDDGRWRIVSEEGDELGANSLPDATFRSRTNSSVLSIPDDVGDLFAFDLVPDPGSFEGRQSQLSPCSLIRRELAYTRQDRGDTADDPADHRHQHNHDQPAAAPTEESEQKPSQELSTTLESTAEPSSNVSDNHPSCQQSCLPPDGGRRSSTAALTSSFLISFLVDARGGAMQGSRCAGIRVIVPPDTVCMPTRITCRNVRKEKLLQCPALSDGEGLATRVLEMGPDGVVFSGPVVIEVSHFASLQDGKREVIVVRSDNGQKWFEHPTASATDDAAIEALCGGVSDESVQKMKIITHTFPRYFALISRFRCESTTIGPEGGTLTSKALPDVRAMFPPESIKRSTKVQLQVNPVDDGLVAKVFGCDVLRLSPVVTIDPRHRRFHQPIALTIPLPKSMNDSTELKRSNLRVFSSRSEGTMPAVWEDITDAIAMTILNGSATLLVTVSARFWLIDSSGKEVSLSEVTELYQETLAVPFWSKFLVFAKRLDENEARIRLFSVTDDQLDKTLDNQESFTEVARSDDVEVFDGKPIQVEVTGNLLPQFDKLLQTLSINFHAFRENRLPFSVKIRSPAEDLIGQVSLTYKPKSTPDGSSEQTVICVLTVGIPDLTSAALEEQEKAISTNALKSDAQISKAELHLTDIADILDADWLPLAVQLGLTQDEVSEIQVDYDYLPEQALIMLHQWVVKNGEKATGNSLERALKQIGRADVIAACMHNISEVTDDRERMVAKNYIKDSDSRDELTSPRFLGRLSSRDSSARHRRHSSDVSYGDISSLPESRSFCYDTGSDIDSETEKEEYKKTPFDDRADDRCFYVDGSINSSAYANIRSTESEDSDAVLSDGGASDVETGNAYDRKESWSRPQWNDVVLRRNRDEARVMADATARLSQVSDATMTPEDREESDRELTPCVLEMAASSSNDARDSRGLTPLSSNEENHNQGSVLKLPETVERKRVTQDTSDHKIHGDQAAGYNKESDTRDAESESSEVVLHVKEGDLFLSTDISNLEELLGDGTRVKRRTITRKQMKPVEEKLVRGDDVLETRTKDEVIRIEVEEDITELEPGIEDEFGAHLDCETTTEEFEEMLEDGVVVQRKVTRVRVRRSASVASSLSDWEIAESSIGKNSDSNHDLKISGSGNMEDSILTKLEEHKSLEESLIPVSSQSVVSLPPIQIQVPTEETKSPPMGDGTGTVHRLVGEVFLETEEGSEEGISENGMKRSRKIRTTRHILPITEIIRGDRGSALSKRFEIVGTEIEEEILETPPDMDFDSENGESETSVEESEETMPDGTWIKKKTTWVTVTPSSLHLSSGFGVNEFNMELNQKSLPNADVILRSSGEETCDDIHGESRPFLYTDGKMDESLPYLRTNDSNVDNFSLADHIAFSESNDLMKTDEWKHHFTTDKFDVDAAENSVELKQEIYEKTAVVFTESEEHKKLKVAETLNTELDRLLYDDPEKQAGEQQHSAEYRSVGETGNTETFANYETYDNGFDQTTRRQTDEFIKEMDNVAPSGDDGLNKNADNRPEGSYFINISDQNSASDSDAIVKKVDLEPALKMSFNEKDHNALLDSDELVKETNQKLALDTNLIMDADEKVDLINERNKIDQQHSLQLEGLVKDVDHRTETEETLTETFEEAALDSKRPAKEVDQKAGFDPVQLIEMSSEWLADNEGLIKKTDHDPDGSGSQIQETAQRLTEGENQIKETYLNPADVASQITETDQNPADVASQITETDQNPADVASQITETDQNPADVASQITETDQNPADVASQITETDQNPADVASQITETDQNPADVASQITETDQNPADVASQITETGENQIKETEQNHVDVESHIQDMEQKPADAENQLQGTALKPADVESQTKEIEQKPGEGEALMNAIAKKTDLSTEESSAEECNQKKPSDTNEPSIEEEMDGKSSLYTTITIKGKDQAAPLDSEEETSKAEQQSLIEGVTIEGDRQPPLSTGERTVEEEWIADSVRHPPSVDSVVKFIAAEKIHGPEIPKSPQLSQSRPENIELHRKSVMHVSIEAPVADEAGVKSDHLLAAAAAESTLLPEMGSSPTESSWCDSKMIGQDDVEQDEHKGREISAYVDDSWQHVETEFFNRADNNTENQHMVLIGDTSQDLVIGTRKETPSYISDKMVESKIFEMINLGHFRHLGFGPNAPHTEQTVSASDDNQSMDKAQQSASAGSYAKAEGTELNAEEDDFSRALTWEDEGFSDVPPVESLPARSDVQSVLSAFPEEGSHFHRDLLESSAVEDFDSRQSETVVGEVGCEQVLSSEALALEKNISSSIETATHPEYREVLSDDLSQGLLDSSMNLEFKETTLVQEGIADDSVLEARSVFATQHVRDDISRPLDSALGNDFAPESVLMGTTEQGLDGIESFARSHPDLKSSEVLVRHDFQFEPSESVGCGSQFEPSESVRHDFQFEPSDSARHDLQFEPSESVGLGCQFEPSESVRHDFLFEPSESVRHDFQFEPSESVGLGCQFEPSESVRHDFHFEPSDSARHDLQFEPSDSVGHDFQFEPSESVARDFQFEPSESVRHGFQFEPSESVRHDFQFEPSELVRHDFQFEPSESVRHDLQFDQSESVRHGLQFEPSESVRHDLQFEPSESVRHDFPFEPSEFIRGDVCDAETSELAAENGFGEDRLNIVPSDILAKYGFRSKPLDSSTHFGLDEKPLRTDSISEEPERSSQPYGSYTEPTELASIEAGILNDESQTGMVTDSNNEPVLRRHLSSGSSDILAKYGFPSKPSELSAGGYGVNREPEVSATRFGGQSYISHRDEPHRMSELQQDESEAKALEEPPTPPSTTPRSKRINFSRPERRLRKASQEGSAEGLPMSPPEREHISWLPSPTIRADFRSTVFPADQDPFSSVSTGQSNVGFPVEPGAGGDVYSPSSQFENELKSPFLRGGCRSHSSPLKSDEEITPLVSSSTQSIVTPDSPPTQDIVSPVSSEKRDVLVPASAVRTDICSPVSSAKDALPPIPPTHYAPHHSDVGSSAFMKHDFRRSRTSPARQAIHSPERKEPRLPASPVRREDVRSVTSPDRHGIRSRTSPMRQTVHSPSSQAWQDVQSPFSSLRRDTVSPTKSRGFGSSVAEDSISVASSRRYRSPTPPSSHAWQGVDSPFSSLRRDTVSPTRSRGFASTVEEDSTSAASRRYRSPTSPTSPSSHAWQDVHSPFSSLRRDTVSPTSRVFPSTVGEDSTTVASSRRYRSPTPPTGRDFSFRSRIRRPSREALSDVPLSLPPKDILAESSLYTPTSPPIGHDIYSPLQTTRFRDDVLDSPPSMVEPDGDRPRLTRQPSLLQSTLEAHSRYLDAITKIEAISPGILPNPALMGPDVTQETIKGKIRCSTSDHEEPKIETEDRTIMKKSTMIQYYQPVVCNFYRNGILIDSRNSEVILGKYVDDFVYDSPTDLTSLADLNADTTTSVDVSEETLADGTWVKHKTTRVVVGPTEEPGASAANEKSVASGKSSTQDFPRISSSLTASDLLPLVGNHPILIPQIMSRLGLQSADSNPKKIPFAVDTPRSQNTLSGKELVAFLLAERRKKENDAAESMKHGVVALDFDSGKESPGKTEQLIQGSAIVTEVSLEANQARSERFTTPVKMENGDNVNMEVAGSESSVLGNITIEGAANGSATLRTVSTDKYVHHTVDNTSAVSLPPLSTMPNVDADVVKYEGKESLCPAIASTQFDPNYSAQTETALVETLAMTPAEMEVVSDVTRIAHAETGTTRVEAETETSIKESGTIPSTETQTASIGSSSSQLEPTSLPPRIPQEIVAEDVVLREAETAEITDINRCRSQIPGSDFPLDDRCGRDLGPSEMIPDINKGDVPGKADHLSEQSDVNFEMTETVADSELLSSSASNTLPETGGDAERKVIKTTVKRSVKRKVKRVHHDGNVTPTSSDISPTSEPDIPGSLFVSAIPASDISQPANPGCFLLACETLSDTVEGVTEPMTTLDEMEETDDVSRNTAGTGRKQIVSGIVRDNPDDALTNNAKEPEFHSTEVSLVQSVEKREKSEECVADISFTKAPEALPSSSVCAAAKSPASHEAKEEDGGSGTEV